MPHAKVRTLRSIRANLGAQVLGWLDLLIFDGGGF
jgi:hypothetical protein